jgi:hypothetical protein
MISSFDRNKSEKYETNPHINGKYQGFQLW